jgi:hypothetical protein
MPIDINVNIPADDRPNSVPIGSPVTPANINGAQSIPEAGQVANYRPRPVTYPDASQPRNPAQGGL